MKSKTVYREAPKHIARAIAEAKIIPDFLPPPDQLVLREDNVKVTLSLTRKSVDFFKRTAGKKKVPYQTMIKNLLDLYSNQFEKSSRGGHSR